MKDWLKRQAWARSPQYVIMMSNLMPKPSQLTSVLTVVQISSRRTDAPLAFHLQRYPCRRFRGKFRFADKGSRAMILASINVPVIALVVRSSNMPRHNKKRAPHGVSEIGGERQVSSGSRFSTWRKCSITADRPRTSPRMLCNAFIALSRPR